MGTIFYALAAIAVGVSLALQPPINVVMARTLESSLLAATISIAISLIFVVIIWVAVGRGSGDLQQIKALPWWIVIGGIIGVVFVAGSIMLAPLLGVALFFVCVVAGQLVGSVIVDQFGAFGMEIKPLNMMKLVGLALVLVGAALVQKSGM